MSLSLNVNKEKRVIPSVLGYLASLSTLPSPTYKVRETTEEDWDTCTQQNKYIHTSSSTSPPSSFIIVAVPLTELFVALRHVC